MRQIEEQFATMTRQRPDGLNGNAVPAAVKHDTTAVAADIDNDYLALQHVVARARTTIGGCKMRFGTHDRYSPKPFQLKNLDKRICKETGLPVSIAADPLCSVVLGTAKLLAVASQAMSSIPEFKRFKYCTATLQLRSRYTFWLKHSVGCAFREASCSTDAAVTADWTFIEPRLCLLLRGIDGFRTTDSAKFPASLDKCQRSGEKI